jgi:hypothetical protein
MGHALPLSESTSLEVLLDIASEEHLLGVTLAALPRPGDHVRIAFAPEPVRGAARAAVKKREFRVDRVTFSGTLTRRGDDWRGRPFATILEVTEVPVNRAFLPARDHASEPNAPADSAARLSLETEIRDEPLQDDE